MGFCCKITHESFFVKQKVGMEAIVPDNINHNCRDGFIPERTYIIQI